MIFVSEFRHGRTGWVDVPCSTIRKEACQDHQKSDAPKKQSCLNERSRPLRVENTVENEKTVNRKAMKKVMSRLYWLVKKELPQHTKFKSLLSTAKSLGLGVLNVLNVGDNASYTSNDLYTAH